ncbi:MAG TPA: histidine phosphotransferase family protein [Acetobacteraceae bacterium]|nr:histidine phosphotransferase family protein [Acetobacteraceae bacterium]
MTSISQSLGMAELLCARLCHDLSGSLGALVGVIEIAREEQPASETLALADETVSELSLRLKLLRAAWGYDGGDLDVARLRALTDGLSSSRRVRLNLAGLEPGSVFQQPAARVVLNLVLFAAECLGGGGVVALAGSLASGLSVSIAGPRAAWPAELGVWLGDAGAAQAAMLADPRRLQGPLTALLVLAAGMRLSTNSGGWLVLSLPGK